MERAGIVKKVAFPREILALSTVGAQIFYFSMQAIAMAVILVALQARPTGRSSGSSCRPWRRSW